MSAVSKIPVTRVITSHVFAITDNPDYQQCAVVTIPEGYKYVTSSVMNRNSHGHFTISRPEFVYRDSFRDQVIEVRVTAVVIPKLFIRSWIAAELSVTIEAL